MAKKKSKLIEEFKVVRKEFEKKAKTALKEAFKAFFAKHPEVQEVRWTQYAPYFNDGDECTFSVNEPVFLGGISLPGWYKANGYSEILREKTSAEEALFEAAGEIRDLITDDVMSDLMKDIFGNHVCVKATPDGEFVAEDYEHE